MGNHGTQKWQPITEANIICSTIASSVVQGFVKILRISKLTCMQAWQAYNWNAAVI